jgi:outer membrane lipase/esterase
MNKALIFILVVVLLAGCSSNRISSVVAFGDSYADNGACYTLWQESVANGETDATDLKNWDANWEHRLTNGPVAVEVLAEQLKVDLKDYAICAAMAGQGNINVDKPALNNTGLLAQIDKFEADLKGQKADPNGLYLITIGSSEAYASNFSSLTDQYKDATPDQVSANIATAITRLANLGAKQIMLWNSADLIPKAPLTTTGGFVKQTEQFKNQLDAQLSAKLADLAKQLNIKIIPFDYNALDAQIRSDPAKYGLTYVTGQCLSSSGQVCPTPDAYLYWDDVSLSAHANQIIAEAMASQLGK